MTTLRTVSAPSGARFGMSPRVPALAGVAVVPRAALSAEGTVHLSPAAAAAPKPPAAPASPAPAAQAKAGNGLDARAIYARQNGLHPPAPAPAATATAAAKRGVPGFDVDAIYDRQNGRG